MSKVNSTRSTRNSSRTETVDRVEVSCINPLISPTSNSDTIVAVNNVLAFIMNATVNSPEMGEFGRTGEHKASPASGISLILECCVIALMHCQQEGGAA